MDLSSFYDQFRDETSENLRIFSDGLLLLERLAPDDPAAREQINAVFRAIHTIKGSARMLGFSEIGRLAHTLEHQLSAVRAGPLTLTPDLISTMLKSGDALQTLTGDAVAGRPATVAIEPLIAALDGDAQPAPPSADSAPMDDTPEPEPAPAPVPEPARAAQAPVSAPETPPAPTAAPPTPRRSRAPLPQTIRVRTDRLDRLLNLTGELVIEEQVLLVHGQMLERLIELVDQHERTTRALLHEIRQIRLSPYEQQRVSLHTDSLHQLSSEVLQLVHHEDEHFRQFVNQHRVLVGDLEEEVITTRLLPIATVFTNLPRAVRELALATGKQVELKLMGEATELDRKLLEALSDPLLHIVRNAVDHGIEPPDERIALGKPVQGTITVQADAVGSEVHIVIEDDGRGIDPQQVRETAIRKGLIGAEQAMLLTDQETLDLVFAPGFTTARILTDISGRGVGMDVVRTNITELSGQVVLDSTVGKGTRINITLPLTLVTTRVVLVQVAGFTFALPASGARGITWVYQRDVQPVEGQATCHYKGQTVPVLRLGDLLDIPGEPPFLHDDRMPALVLGTGQRSMALLVDRLLDEREAVIKPISDLVAVRRRYSGAIQFGDGQVVLLLNPVTLANLARGTSLTLARDGTARPTRHRLLIADDSFTTRELIRSILSSVGYDVTAAVDGRDALDKLREDVYDLVVSDVEMPRMNGFELTTRIRQELGLTDLPVIIVTSLASEAHRRQGMEAGAQAYIVKGEFDQDNLLRAIEQLLGR